MMLDEDRKRSRSMIYRKLLERSDFLEGREWVRQHYKSQEFVLSPGERTGRLFLVLSGTVRVVGYVEVGEDCHVRPGVKDLGAGEIFGEISLFDQGVHTAGILSVTDTEIIAMDGRALFEFFEHDPEFGYQFFRDLCASLAKRLRKADQQIFHLLGWGLKAHGFEPYLKDR